MASLYYSFLPNDFEKRQTGALEEINMILRERNVR